MSDLEAKFTELEAQLTTQHTETVALLEAIATALGAPPPGPTTTLEDVVAAIGTTNTLLTAIQSDMNGYLLSIFNTLDTINNNASLNSQRILSTLLQTACPCDATVPLFPPDLGTTPTSAADIAKCQRIQYFIDLFAGWVILVGTYVGETGSISSFQVDNMLAIHVGEVGITTGQIADPMSTGVRDSIVSKIASAVSSEGASSVNYGLFTAMTDSANLEGMRHALYTVTNAAAGRTSLDAMLDSLVGMVEPYLSIIKTMFYSAWLNDIYSDVPIVDASSYDGTICSEITPIPDDENCVIITSTYPVTTDEPQTYNAIVWPQYGTNVLPSSVRPPGYPNITASADIWYNGSNLNGYWIRGTTPTGASYGGRVHLKSDGTAPLDFNGAYQQITIDTDYVFAFGFDTNPFHFEICHDLPE